MGYGGSKGEEDWTKLGVFGGSCFDEGWMSWAPSPALAPRPLRSDHPLWSPRFPGSVDPLSKEKQEKPIALLY